jgi:hypothetical protein
LRRGGRERRWRRFCGGSKWYRAVLGTYADAHRFGGCNAEFHSVADCFGNANVYAAVHADADGERRTDSDAGSYRFVVADCKRADAYGDGAITGTNPDRDANANGDRCDGDQNGERDRSGIGYSYAVSDADRYRHAHGDAYPDSHQYHVRAASVRISDCDANGDGHSESDRAVRGNTNFCCYRNGGD